MDTDAALRLQTWRLLRLGLSQKVIANRMDISASALNRWLHREKKKPISVGALDGLKHLLADLKDEATRDFAALTKDEREQLEAELAATKTEHRISRLKKKQARSRAGVKGRKLASR